VTRKARWVFATSNAGKVAELAALLDASGLAIELVAQSALGVKPAKETATTFVENALRKARHAARATGLPAIADDSGLAVDALAGAPSVRSARFAGPRATDERNNALLLERLADVPDGKRQGRFHCVLVALRGPEDPAPLIAAGEWSGFRLRSRVLRPHARQDGRHARCCREEPCQPSSASPPSALHALDKTRRFGVGVTGARQFYAHAGRVVKKPASCGDLLYTDF
jgi:XTP/dITP diphosphohydrolase